MPSYFFNIIDILGTFAFAVSGTSSAIKKQLDVFGILVIAFVTSIGGGTLRDILIGQTPVAWLQNEIAMIVIIVGAVLTFFLQDFILKFNYTLFLFDALGLGLFTLTGIQRGMDMHFSAGICIALGTITACFGGVIRDTLLNDIPLIFRKEVYASACIAGGICYFALRYFQINDNLAQISCIMLITVVRIVAFKYHLTLPSANNYLNRNQI